MNEPGIANIQLRRTEQMQPGMIVYGIKLTEDIFETKQLPVIAASDCEHTTSICAMCLRVWEQHSDVEILPLNSDDLE